MALTLLPVLAFLSALIVLDTFRLIRSRYILLAIVIGAAAALVCLGLNSLILHHWPWETKWFSRYLAPAIEETLKALYLVYLIRRHRVGFLVDSAIQGFAVGAGFACIENVYYLQSLPDPNLLLWIVRGFGTAIMHGGTTAIFAVMARTGTDRHERFGVSAYLPGLMVAIAIHAFFNHFFMPPLLSTLVLLIALPFIMLLVFQHSEKSTRDWLDLGFDTDRELLELLDTGRISETRIGAYLQSLKKTFPAEIVVDMLCLMRLQLELSIRAKGLMLLREAGFQPAPDPEVKNKFEELKYLEKSISKTGLLAIAPFVHTKSQDLWQLNMLVSSE